MDVESARQLRDRERGKEVSLSAESVDDKRKTRIVRLDTRGQSADRVREALCELESLIVEEAGQPNAVSISYDINEHTLESIENALRAWGYHLDDSLISKLYRALIYYSEATELRGFRQPEQLSKKYHVTYSQAWERHSHGDRDETPHDLRQDR